MAFEIEPITERNVDTPLSAFPVEEDSFKRMTDITSSLMPLVIQYNNYFNTGNMTACNKLLADNPMLKQCFFSAGDYNKLCDIMVAMERFLIDQVSSLYNAIATSAIGINDNPNEEEASLVAYSAEKVESIIDDLQRTVIVTLPASGWSASAPYSQRVAVPGIKATDEPELKSYIPKSLNANTVKLRQKLTGMITDGETTDGFVTIYCGAKKPTADFQIMLKGVSENE